MKRLFLTALVVITYALNFECGMASSEHPDNEAFAPGSPVLLFLAMGQSNMVGPRPPDRELIGDEYDSRILHRSSSGTPRDHEAGDCMLKDGTIGQSNFQQGVQGGGPDRIMARSIARAGFQVAVVKWARNGSSISHWSRDQHPDASGSYYDCWMAYLLDAMAELEKRGLHVQIGGFLWSQGAADSNAGGGRHRSPHYEERLRALIQRFRTEVEGADSAPVMVVRTSTRIDDERYPFKHTVRAAQISVVESDPNAVWIDIDDVPLRDLVHHTSEGYQTIGLRAAESWLAAFGNRFSRTQPESKP